MNKFTYWISTGLAIFLAPFFAQAEQTKAHNFAERVSAKQWIHGAADCSKDTHPAIDILELNEHTYILRQNKCIHYEAPFIYVLLGDEKVFIQDTGATESEELFPLFETIKTLVTKYQSKHGLNKLQWVVSHSHGHGDHIAGDKQFKNREGVQLIEPNTEAVKSFFGFNDWPNGQKTLELGNRTLTVLPLPGHKQDAVAVHDDQTHIMLTGDSFYPGRLYIKDWPVFKQSMATLLTFAKANKVTTFLGTHIEMSNLAGKDYEIGSTYHPNERHLVLTIEDLIELNTQLQRMGDKAEKVALDSVIIYPLK